MLFFLFQCFNDFHLQQVSVKSQPTLSLKYFQFRHRTVENKFLFKQRSVYLLLKVLYPFLNIRQVQHGTKFMYIHCLLTAEQILLQLSDRIAVSPITDSYIYRACSVDNNSRFNRIDLKDREAELRPLIPAIRAAKAANAACYGPAYGCLRAVHALAQSRRQLLGREQVRAVTREALTQLSEGALPRSETPGTERRIYLSGITPKGLLALAPGQGRVWAILDGCGAGGPLLRQLADRHKQAGEDLILAMDPLDPDAVQGVLLPERRLGWLRVHPSFPGPRQAMLRLDLDAALEAALPDELADGMRELAGLEQRLLGQAVGWLRQAKAQHDLIEELYRPAVDFAAVTRETEMLCRELFTES